MAQDHDSTRLAYTSHPRRWREFRFVYPVISRRSKGMSIGINLSPDQVCNYRCVYCQVDRSRPAGDHDVDLDIVAAELRAIIQHRDQVFEDEKLKDLPKELRAVRDIAFSGDGEPTIALTFPAAARLAAEVRREFGLTDTKIVVITNGCFLERPEVIETLAHLDEHNGEIWAKLDAGTQKYYEQVNGPGHPLGHLLDNLLATARVRPIVIQSLFMRMHDQPTAEKEIAAYIGRLRTLLDKGGQLKLVQVYTVARRPAQPWVSALSRETLDDIAARVRELGVAVEVFV